MDGCWLEEGWQQWADARRGERWRPVASLPPNPSSPTLVAPPAPTDPSPIVPKKKEEEDQRHFHDKPQTGGRGSIVFVSKCGECDSVVMTDTPKMRGATFCRFLFPPDLRSFWGVVFDRVQLTMSPPSSLSCTMRDHSAVFLPPSATPTHKHEHTNTRAAAPRASLGCWAFLRQPTEDKKKTKKNGLSFRGCFRIQERRRRKKKKNQESVQQRWVQQLTQYKDKDEYEKPAARDARRQGGKKLNTLH